MALVFSNIASSARSDQLRHGLTVRQCDMTVQSADYSSGFDLGASAAKAGFRTIYAVLQASAKNGSGTFLPLLWWNYDFTTGKLRVANATSEANAAATLTNGSVVRLVLLGV